METDQVEDFAESEVWITLSDNPHAPMLTSKESEIFYALSSAKQGGISKKEIASIVWQEAINRSKALQVHLSNLKGKLKHSNIGIQLNSDQTLELVKLKIK